MSRKNPEPRNWEDYDGNDDQIDALVGLVDDLYGQIATLKAKLKKQKATRFYVLMQTKIEEPRVKEFKSDARRQKWLANQSAEFDDFYSIDVNGKIMDAYTSVTGEYDE